MCTHFLRGASDEVFPGPRRPAAPGKAAPDEKPPEIPQKSAARKDRGDPDAQEPPAFLRKSPAVLQQAHGPGLHSPGRTQPQEVAARGHRPVHAVQPVPAELVGPGRQDRRRERAHQAPVGGMDAQLHPALPQ